MSEKRYGTKSEKQKAYRERKKNLSGGVVDDLTSDQGRSQPKNKAELISPTQNNLPAPVLAEPKHGKKSDREPSCGEARESTTKPKLDEETRTAIEETTRGGQSFSYDKKKYPNRAAWEIAVQRVERAVRWAKKFPNHIYAGDLKFQTLDWQYQNEGIKSAPK